MQATKYQCSMDKFQYLNRAIFKLAADTRKKPFCYSPLCEMASDAVGVVKLEISQGFNF